MEPAEIGFWFERMAPGLVLYARQIVHTAGGAEDVVQEVFVRLAGQVKMPEREPGGVKGWLLLAVRRAALDAAKKDRRRVARERRAGAERLLVADIPGAGVPAEEVEQALARLALEEREIVTLRIWNDATFEEIAGTVGMPVSTVHHRYRSALERLRARWEVPCRKS